LDIARTREVVFSLGPLAKSVRGGEISSGAFVVSKAF
jgi:hypothetical protein